MGGSVGDTSSSDENSSRQQPVARAQQSPRKTKTRAHNKQMHDVCAEHSSAPKSSSSSRSPSDQDIDSDPVEQDDEIPGVRENTSALSAADQLCNELEKATSWAPRSDGEEAISIGAAGGRTITDDSVAEDVVVGYAPVVPSHGAEHSQSYAYRALNTSDGGSHQPTDVSQITVSSAVSMDGATGGGDATGRARQLSPLAHRQSEQRGPMSVWATGDGDTKLSVPVSEAANDAQFLVPGCMPFENIDDSPLPKDQTKASSYINE